MGPTETTNYEGLPNHIINIGISIETLFCDNNFLIMIFLSCVNDFLITKEIILSSMVVFTWFMNF
jgi:hypothetical protein